MGVVSAVVAGIVGVILSVTSRLEPLQQYRRVRTVLRVCGLAMVVLMVVDSQTVVETIVTDAQRTADEFMEWWLSGVEEIGTRPPPTTAP